MRDAGDVLGRSAGLAQALEQVGVLVPDDQLGIEELALGATANASSVSREIAKHHAAKSSRTAPSIVCGKATARRRPRQRGAQRRPPAVAASRRRR